MDELISNIIFILLAVGVTAIGKIFKSIKAKPQNQPQETFDKNNDEFDDDDDELDDDEEDNECNETYNTETTRRTTEIYTTHNIPSMASTPQNTIATKTTDQKQNSNFTYNSHHPKAETIEHRDTRLDKRPNKNTKQYEISRDYTDFGTTEEVKRAIIASEIFNHKYF